MEIFIIMCLVAIIMLLVLDKSKFNNNSDRTTMKDSIPERGPNIMGSSKSTDHLAMSKSASNYQYEQMLTASANLVLDNEPIIYCSDIESLNEIVDKSDWIEEEEELQQYATSSIENSLAQGVTFEELSAVGVLLQNGNSEHSQKETAVLTVQKLQGTELFNLLEISADGAAQKIAMLLANALTEKSPIGSSTLLKDDLGNFDIGKFI